MPQWQTNPLHQPNTAFFLNPMYDASAAGMRTHPRLEDPNDIFAFAPEGIRERSSSYNDIATVTYDVREREERPRRRSRSLTDLGSIILDPVVVCSRESGQIGHGQYGWSCTLLWICVRITACRQYCVIMLCDRRVQLEECLLWQTFLLILCFGAIASWLSCAFLCIFHISCPVLNTL